MQNSPTHFSEIIEHEYNARVSKNTGYSIRAFARDLNISPATLSLILKKKAGLSLKKIEVISKKLNLSGDEKDFFQTLAQSNCSRSKHERHLAKLRLSRFETKYNSLSTDLFCVIKDWYHLAIVELTQIKGFENGAEWIANKLKITKEEATEGLERLIRLEILINNEGKLQPANDYYIVLSGGPSEAAKHFQTQILSKIANSFDLVDRSTRDIATSIIRMRKDDMEYVRKTLKDNRRDLAAYLEAGEGHDSVFCLTTSCFRLDVDN